MPPPTRRWACPAPSCGTTFSRHADLLRHERNTHRESKLFCNFQGCNFKGAARPGVLRKHLLARHSEFYLPGISTRHKNGSDCKDTEFGSLSPSPELYRPSSLHFPEPQYPPIPSLVSSAQLIEEWWNDPMILQQIYTTLKSLESSDPGSDGTMSHDASAATSPSTLDRVWTGAAYEPSGSTEFQFLQRSSVEGEPPKPAVVPSKQYSLAEGPESSCM
ncbi:hypothetical protein LZ554_007803 [Drepanopeziza brunnea f. sp. 'monogermtubi']|nr:hypothetical protein LZ554_007803 [Drepanopeziza brunnea f. sp. 'monogermtubi']